MLKNYIGRDMPIDISHNDDKAADFLDMLENSYAFTGPPQAPVEPMYDNA